MMGTKNTDEDKDKAIHNKAIQEFAKTLKRRCITDYRREIKYCMESDIDEIMKILVKG